MNFRKDLVLRYLRSSSNRMRQTQEHLVSQNQMILDYQALKGFKDEPPQYTEVEVSLILSYLSEIENHLNTIQNIISDTQILEYSRNSDSTPI